MRMIRCALVINSMTFSALFVPAFVPSLPALSTTDIARPAAVTLSGTVTDAQHAPLRDVIVSLAEVARSVMTDAQGHFDFGALPAGTYHVRAQRLGYVSASIVADVHEGSAPIAIAMSRGALRLEPVNVTASRDPGSSLLSAMPTSVLSGDQIHGDAGISLAHSIGKVPGVRTVSTGEQVGKPMIRGMFGPRVLVMADGHRLEDYSWSDEDGPSIDARLAQRIEVVRGPASVLYGSDAVGGVVNVVPEAVPVSNGTNMRRYSAEAYGASNNIELGSALKVEGTQGAYGYRVLGTGRFSMNYQTPAGEQQNSGFFAVNGDAALGRATKNGSFTLRFSHYGGEFGLLEATGPEAGDSTGGPVRQMMDDRLQYTQDVRLGGMRLETRAQFQRHALAEVSDDCQPAPGETTCVKVKDKQAFALTLNTGTLDVLAHHTIGTRVNGTIGVSGGLQSSTSDGPIFIVPSASISTGAVYALERLTFGKVDLIGGARADVRSMQADSNASLQQGKLERAWSAGSGMAGVVIHPTDKFALLGNVGRGWRAPTLFDLLSNGLNRGDARYEIGDPTMTTESSLNVDVGARYITERVHAELSVFNNTIDHYIFVTPTGETRGGLQVFRHVQRDARMSGGEALIEVQANDALTLRASHDEVRGTDRTTSLPLPLVPPMRTQVGAEVHSAGVRAWHAGADVEIIAKPSRLAPVDYATDGYSLVNLSAGMQHAVHARMLRFDVIVRNALNTKYKDFLSRYKTFAYAPGANVIFKVSTSDW